MKFMLYIRIGCLFLLPLFSALSVRGEEILLSLRTLAVDEVEMPEFYVAAEEGDFKPLLWSSRQASTPVNILAGKELVLYSKKMNQDGTPTFILDRKVALPEAADEVLLLAWAEEKAETEEANDAEGTKEEEEQKVEIIAIADDYKKAKFNDWLMINRSDEAVTFHYGEDKEPLTIESGESKTYQIEAELGKGTEVFAETTMKGKMRKFLSTYWAAPDKQRSVVLFYKKDDAVRARRIIDFLN